MNIIKRIILSITIPVLLTLTGCGGGGDGGVVGPPAAGISITAANAEVITATVVNSVNVVEGISSGSGILAGVVVTPAGAGFSYPDFFLKELQWLPSLAGRLNTGSLAGVTVPPTDVKCTDVAGGSSGTFTVSGDVTDPTLTVFYVGDTFNIVFNACVIDGIEMNGGMSMKIANILPSPWPAAARPIPPYSISLDTVLNGFSANDAGFIVTGDGDMSVSVDVATSGDVTTVLSGNSVLASAGSESERLTSYLYDILNNAITGNYSVEASGTIATTTLGGSVSYVTTTPFTGNDNVAPDPTGGVMHITTTANSSQARVTAMSDGINVQIEVDADGDSMYESTSMTTWTVLRSTP